MWDRISSPPCGGRERGGEGGERENGGEGGRWVEKVHMFYILYMYMYSTDCHSKPHPLHCGWSHLHRTYTGTNLHVHVNSVNETRQSIATMPGDNSFFLKMSCVRDSNPQRSAY